MVAARYPDAKEQQLAEALGRLHGVAPEQIVLGCGSGEILKMADDAFLGPGKAVIAAEPTFEAVFAYAVATKAEPVVVRGKLLDADGKPLANVPVRLWSVRDGDKMAEPVATTDAAGAFQLKPNQQQVEDNALVLVSPPGLPAEKASRYRIHTSGRLRSYP